MGVFLHRPLPGGHRSIHLQAPDFTEVAEWQVEPVYKTQFAQEEIPDRLYAQLQGASCHHNPQLRLPVPNPFIARNFELHGAPGLGWFFRFGLRRTRSPFLCGRPFEAT